MTLRSLTALLLLLGSTSALLPNETCALTGMAPKVPRYLKFCQDYNDKACCIPGHDLENQLQFEYLIDGLGPGCKNPMMYPAIRYFYCLGCDPLQPNYTSPKEDDPTVEVVRICSDFVEQALWSNETRDQYEDCGVMKPNKCPAIMSDFDPYTCGDDLIIPTIEFDDATQFMNYFKPPGMYDYEFIVVAEDTLKQNELCWKPKSMRVGQRSAASSRSSRSLRHFW